VRVGERELGKVREEESAMRESKTWKGVKVRHQRVETV
jgi:hypothetical protein